MPKQPDPKQISLGFITEPTAEIVPRNEVWDALIEVFGEPTTTTSKTLRGKVTRSLKDAGATRQEIYVRAQAWPLHFAGATLTETALEKHWDRLGRPPLRVSSHEVERAIRAAELKRRFDGTE